MSNQRSVQRARAAAMALLFFWTAGVAVGQSSLRSWGLSCTDTEARDGAFVHVDASAYTSAAVREDGRINCYGVNHPFGHAETFPLPPGQRYQKVSMGGYYSLGLLSDGNVIGIGSMDLSGFPVPVPGLPIGERYIDIAAGNAHALLLRSDFTLVGIGDSNFGQLAVPQFAAGLYPIEIAAGAAHTLLRLNDGSIVAFGRNTLGQCNVPSLPPGQSYVKMDAFSDTSAAVRSDGELFVWGDNTYGQCNVPPGTYSIAAVGASHTVAWRTDGVFVAFGDNTQGQLGVPTAAAGVECKAIACGAVHTVALMTDGSLLSWGDDTYEQSTVPVIPMDPSEGGRMRLVSVAAGGPYNACVLADGTLRQWGHQYLSSMPLPFPNKEFKRIELGWGTAVVLTTDGRLLAWGGNVGGGLNVPQLPAGVVYVDFDTCYSHTVAIRSDGQVERFGTFWMPTLPPLPAGQRYIHADAEGRGTILLRSDGTVIVAGAGSNSVNIVPPAGAGLSYRKVAHCYDMAAALRTDGTMALWGNVATGPNAIWRPLPALPTGVVYVEISGGESCISARRSDGLVVAGGWTAQHREHVVPPLLPGTSYVEVDGGNGTVAARVGPTSTYISFYPGCAGTRPATRLIPADTPRIGNALEVRLFDLPIDFAFVALGFARTAPIALDFAGMPGCEAHISLDQITFAAGQGGQAMISVPIPDRRSLIGARFYHQAFVLDPAAGNAAGAVASAAAEAVVGDW